MTLRVVAPPTAPTLGHDLAIGMTVRQYLYLNGVQLDDLAQILGLSDATVSRKLNGKTAWSAGDVLRTSGFLGLTPNDVMPTLAADGTWEPAPVKPSKVSLPAEWCAHRGSNPGPAD